MKTFEEVLEVVNFLNEIDQQFWTFAGSDGEIHICLNMNDFFYWGCADSEEITIEDLPDAKKAITDCAALGEVTRTFGEKDLSLDAGEWYGMDLWACRKRKQLPQDPVLNKFPEPVQKLFRETYLK